MFAYVKLGLWDLFTNLDWLHVAAPALVWMSVHKEGSTKRDRTKRDRAKRDRTKRDRAKRDRTKPIRIYATEYGPSVPPQNESPSSRRGFI